MKNLISALIISMIIFTFSAQCFAKTTLTYIDTVVLDAQSENTREVVLNQVLISAKDSVLIIPESYYTLGNQTPQASFSTLKEIFKASSQSFLKK